MDEDPKEAIEAYLPKLKTGGYTLISPADMNYNCVAFAAGDYKRWWELSYGSPKHYWPPGVPSDETVDDWTRAFRMLNYEITDSFDPESGYDRIAIYSLNKDDASHVAVQLDGHGWMSKLGDSHDIAHDSPHLLECDEDHSHKDCYGIIHVVMKRKSFRVL